MLARCQEGFEPLLARELAESGVAELESGGGWVLTVSDAPETAGEWCFPHALHFATTEVRGTSVKALAEEIAGCFFASARAERFEEAWPLAFTTAGGLPGLGRRAASVEAAVREALRRRMARVARLASSELPRLGAARGLFAHFTSFNRAVVSRAAWLGGQKRMADNPAAPSRSYLKVEEAYGILGQEPGVGDTVVDLGAAPGGWSFSAARRGARVIAVDNGPLKGGALGHAAIEHRREDAFRFRPPAGEVFDWLFCDLVEDPHHVLDAIVTPWLSGGWCGRLVVNLKFGRADAVALLGKARRVLAGRCGRFHIRHLFHDRDEFTLVGIR